jgi:hypothetical protein
MRQADVQDQMEYVLSQLDVIAGIGQNLVDYTFNVRVLLGFIRCTMYG